MSNSVEHKAFSLTNNVFMNFTTKFVKGVTKQSNSPNTSIKTNNNQQNPSSKSLNKVTDQANINRNLSSLINQPSIVNQIQNSKIISTNQNSPAAKNVKDNNVKNEDKAMNLTKQSYMNSTTKYVKSRSNSP